ncbi:MAG: hypothetical protein K8L99_04860 [Anaerolineae bacterium]|nr:hypothetical protein [Anaerolineae bacterium]
MRPLTPNQLKTRVLRAFRAYRRAEEKANHFFDQYQAHLYLNPQMAEQERLLYIQWSNRKLRIAEVMERLTAPEAVTE